MYRCGISSKCGLEVSKKGRDKILVGSNFVIFTWNGIEERVISVSEICKDLRCLLSRRSQAVAEFFGSWVPLQLTVRTTFLTLRSWDLSLSQIIFCYNWIWDANTNKRSYVTRHSVLNADRYVVFHFVSNLSFQQTPFFIRGTIQELAICIIGKPKHNVCCVCGDLEK